MSKNIAIADDVYARLKRRKGRGSFSDAIRDALDAAPRVSTLVGRGELDADRMERGRRSMAASGRRTQERMRDR